MIVDYKGRVMSESNSGETFTAFADIDLGALAERTRRKPAMTNFLARQRLELFAATYAEKCHVQEVGRFDPEQ